MAVGDRTELGGTAYDRLRIPPPAVPSRWSACRRTLTIPGDFAAIYLAANGYAASFH